jgi:NAD(P)-dependent dehydrogenase (short-subunit alcohol dehydrogenase family)
VAKDKPVVLVTGGSSGIGKCCAEFLWQAGYHVYGASRRTRFSPAMADTGVIAIPMDVTSDESVRDGCNLVLKREGRLDVVMNDAGMGIAGAVEDTSSREALEQFDVNVFGVLRVCRAVLPIMRAQGSGYIVNIGSIGGLIAIPYQGLYSASKFALEGLTESLRLEVSRFGIRVVLIEPGDHRTSFTDSRRFTEASSGNSAYRGQFDRAIQRMASDERGGPTPDSVARLVHKVINTANPRLRYTVGQKAQRAAVLLKRVAPYSIMEKIMKRYYAC